MSLDGLVAATEQPPGSLCRACFDGNYPVPVAEHERGYGAALISERTIPGAHAPGR